MGVAGVVGVVGVVDSLFRGEPKRWCVWTEDGGNQPGHGVSLNRGRTGFRGGPECPAFHGKTAHQRFVALRIVEVRPERNASAQRGRAAAATHAIRSAPSAIRHKETCAIKEPQDPSEGADYRWESKTGGAPGCKCFSGQFLRLISRRAIVR